MEWIRYFIFLEALIAMFLAGGLFFKEANLKSRTISLLMAMFGVHMLIFVYGSSELTNLYPVFKSWFYYEIGFLFGPVLFIHLQAFLSGKDKLKWHDLLHLLPIVAYWLFYGDVLFIPSEERVAYVQANFLTRTMTWNYTLAIQMCVYGLANLVLVVKSRHSIEKRKFIYAAVLVIFYLIATTVITWLTWFADGWRDFAIYYLLISLLMFAVGYIIYFDPQFYKAFRKKYFSSSLDESKMNTISEKIEKAFNQDRIFLKNNLSIRMLGRELDEKPYHVSQTFSEKIQINFNDYVNRHRVIYAKALLKDPNYHQFKIEAIAQESGFNNKVTFYKAFTKFIKVTPSKYRKDHLVNRNNLQQK
ncbi:AraC family transcriptional regulator [Pukyongia salina]|uniref:AraC family transcriptional regulator n=1 Tax=Pukyongia salina TaxID=2094025 RepID=A0A2S0HYL8_9FLAO|nr:helix-turn-helix transcriptional regulator [Pukyongia salina]AVI51752.1 AraC family transcriptional regulator [Pukyongia salina]